MVRITQERSASRRQCLVALAAFVLTAIVGQEVHSAPLTPGSALRPLARALASIPLPETAVDIKFDGDDLKFNSSSTIEALAAFYRAVLKPLGWTEKPSIIERENFLALEFAKADDELTFTIMRFGDMTNVIVEGENLKLPAGRR